MKAIVFHFENPKPAINNVITKIVDEDGFLTQMSWSHFDVMFNDNVHFNISLNDKKIATDNVNFWNFYDFPFYFYLKLYPIKVKSGDKLSATLFFPTILSPFTNFQIILYMI